MRVKLCKYFVFTYILVKIKRRCNPIKSFPIKEHIPNFEDFNSFYLLILDLLVFLPNKRKKKSNFLLEIFYVVTLDILYYCINTVD